MSIKMRVFGCVFLNAFFRLLPSCFLGFEFKDPSYYSLSSPANFGFAVLTEVTAVFFNSVFIYLF